MKRRDLSGEERDLWALATRDVKPSKNKRSGRDSKSSTKGGDSVLHPSPALRGRGAGGEGASNRERQPVHAPSPSTRQTLGPAPQAGEGRRTRAAPASRAFGGGDPGADRKAAKGLIPIDARLDLHGMTEPAAQTRVTRFILGAREDGLRLVLVITGKGSRGVSGNCGEGRGVIRARFLDWIEQAPLRGAIARVAAAKSKDGGAGAFYVFLKRKTRG